MRNSYFKLTIGCILFFGCESQYVDEDYFCGNIQTINDTVSTVQYLSTTPLSLNGANYGFMSTFDSLILFMNPKLRDYSFNIFNINTKEEIGMFCNRGNGPEEIIYRAAMEKHT